MAPESFREHLDEAARRPGLNTSVGILAALLAGPLLALAIFVLYIIPPLAFFLLLAIPATYWVAIAIELSALAQWAGSLVRISNLWSARLAGAALLVVGTLVPVAGFFLMLTVMLMAAGAGAGILLWLRFLRPRAASPPPTAVVRTSL